MNNSLEVYDDMSLAFDVCRERNKPITIIFEGDKWKLFPSGHGKKLTERLNKSRFYTVTITNGEVKIDKNVKTFLKSHRYKNVTESSLKRLEQLKNNSIIYRKSPYLVFGN